MKVYEPDGNDGIWKVLSKYLDADGTGHTMEYLNWCPKTGFEGRKLVAEALIASKKCIDAEEALLEFEEREPLYKEANEKAEKAFLYAGCLDDHCPMCIRKKGKYKDTVHIFCGIDPKHVEED